MSIRICLVESLEEIEHFRVLEHLIWGESLEATIPVHVLVTTIHNGGGILGAYTEDGPAETGGMIGLAYWWPGLDTPHTGPQTSSSAPPVPPGPQTSSSAPPVPPGPQTSSSAPPVPPGPQTSSSALVGVGRQTGTSALQLKMCSHMAGVLPPWRGTGLGLALKLRQREAILAQGMAEWVTWTYDPLIRTNGAFNLHRLGAVCNTYHANLYGELPDELNAGVPSDRCQVDWWLNADRVVERAAPGWRGEVHWPAQAEVLSASARPGGLQGPPDCLPAADGAALALPLPDDIHAIRAADHGLGLAWQGWLRAALEGAFGAGYVMVDCARGEDGQWRYLLMQEGPGR